MVENYESKRDNIQFPAKTISKNKIQEEQKVKTRTLQGVRRASTHFDLTKRKANEEEKKLEV